ncbi:MAG TPA: right-handed parallel beta-helix repeat-containing protein [Gaiellaceae bacterium]|nr:right-handed parallel beta-helix repeat-containing protein [Gaiellaceae bacterium]
MRRGVIAVIAIVLATVALPGAVRAVATTQIACGDTVMKSIVAGNDLAGCSGVGLQIVAKNVTLNLNGHTISGDGSGGGNGIDDEGFDNLTVMNGSITGFESGIVTTNGSKLNVTGVTSFANLSKGIVTDGTTNVTIQSSYTHGNSDAGINVHESSPGTIKITGVSSNGDGDGIDTLGGPLTIDSNVIANATTHGDLGFRWGRVQDHEERERPAMQRRRLHRPLASL